MSIVDDKWIQKCAVDLRSSWAREMKKKYRAKKWMSSDRLEGVNRSAGLTIERAGVHNGFWLCLKTHERRRGSIVLVKESLEVNVAEFGSGALKVGDSPNSRLSKAAKFNAERRCPHRLDGDGGVCV